MGVRSLTQLVWGLDVGHWHNDRNDLRSELLMILYSDTRGLRRGRQYNDTRGMRIGLPVAKNDTKSLGTGRRGSKIWNLQQS